MAAVSSSFAFYSCHDPAADELRKQQAAASKEAAEKQFELETNRSLYLRTLQQEQGNRGVRTYLNTKHCVTLATVPAVWSPLIQDTPLHGGLGHHCFIILPGDRVVELRQKHQPSTKLDKSKFTQQEERLLTGAKIEKLWETHMTIFPEQISWLPSLDEESSFYYMPFKSDCFTYLNDILQKVDEPEIMLSRIKTKKIYKAIDKKVSWIFQTILAAHKCLFGDGDSTVHLKEASSFYIY